MNKLVDLLPLLPMAIVALTALVVMVLIALKRSHKLTALMSAIGLNVAFVAVLLQFFGFFPIANGAGNLFIVDGFALFNMAAVLMSALACLGLCYDYFADFADNKEELYLLMLIATLGAMLMVSAKHLAAFFMALELLSVPMYGMLAFTFLKAKSLESGLKYLILSAAASATLLMGMALVFVATGALDFMQIAQNLSIGLGFGPLLVLGAVMMTVAIGFKLSLAPFHLWAGDVYEGAPIAVTAFLASVAKVAVMALAIRFLISTAAPALVSLDAVLVLMIALSVLVGNLLALSQTSIKRLLAFSSVAHMGYALMALVATGSASDGVVSMYMLIYALTSVAVFGVMVLMSGTVKGVEADNILAYQGLFWRRPVLTAVMTVALLSLAGIPLTAGFMTKMQIMLAAVQGGRFGLAGLLIVGSAIGLYYYLKTILVLYKRPLTHIRFDAADNWRQRANGVMILLVTALLLLWGVLPNGLIYWSSLAAISH